MLYFLALLPNFKYRFSQVGAALGTFQERIRQRTPLRGVHDAAPIVAASLDQFRPLIGSPPLHVRCRHTALAAALETLIPDRCNVPCEASSVDHEIASTSCRSARRGLQQLRQLGDAGRDPPRLIARE
jgi:hypothetical protein